MGVSWGDVGTFWGALGDSYGGKYVYKCADAPQNTRTRALLGSRSVYMCADATQNTRTRALLGTNPHGSAATGFRKVENLIKPMVFDGFRGDMGLRE